MAAAGRLKYAYLAYFSKPRELRNFYRLLRTEKPRRIVELGVRSIADSISMLEVAARYCSEGPLQYTAIDAFDAREPQQTPLSLIEAHRLLKATGAKARLVPGTPQQTLPAVANTLLKTDLLLISQDAGQSHDPIGPSWFFVPRMLHADSVVLQRSEAEDGTLTLTRLSPLEIERLAAPSKRRAA